MSVTNVKMKEILFQQLFCEILIGIFFPNSLLQPISVFVASFDDQLDNNLHFGETIVHQEMKNILQVLISFSHRVLMFSAMFRDF